ncbi:MAG: hypothetical protein KJ905_02985 [Nanoarchaeota archaeon]|nr:hypothetical protein [Nanoarchaeota archaeon]MBU1501714.1 hypothetical protein [Nanoarchaeota archaeon]MBU2458932.1 hypothetical protein [Nanoarchaeota archaeon]
MKSLTKIAVLLSFSILLILPMMSAAATIIFEQQPRAIYNYGEKINLPITVTSAQGVYDYLQVSLLCSGQEYKFPKDSIGILPGEVQKLDKSVYLIKRFIGETKGACKIKAVLENEVDSYSLSNEFKISNLINVELQMENNSFNPLEILKISGIATNENGKATTGIFELKITQEENTINSHQGIVSNGVFSMEFEIPGDMAAGTYIVRTDIRGTDPLGETTNLGFASSSMEINQMPTSLEIIFDTTEVEPGTNMKVKAVLYDQSGEKIDATSTIKIKNKNNKIVSQEQKQTNEFLEFPLTYNEPPSLWRVSVAAEGIEKDSTFSVVEKESIAMEIVNRTLMVNNTGNIPYNETTLIKVGDETISIDIYLKVDENRKYLITAPDGSYNVEVISGDSTVSKNVALTGKAIEVKEASGGIGGYTFVWIFIILLLGFVAFLAYRKGYQKTFIGYITSKIKRRHEKEKDHVISVHESKVSEEALVNPGSKAEISLSIQGNKQEVCVVALSIKNSEEAHSKKGNARETLQAITDMTEECKAATYESHDTLFFILAPEKTKTFKNEKTALDIARKAKEIIENHNKLFQQKINFGISLNHGSMIVKQEGGTRGIGGTLKFMSLGTLMANTKKIATLADKDVLLSEKINDKLMAHLKTAKHEKAGISVYSIKEVKKGSEENKEFLKGFLSRNKEKR